MQKEFHQKRFMLLLTLVFLVGLSLVVWPIVKELLAYQADEDEYEAMAMEYRPPEVSPEPVTPVQEATGEPTEEPVIETSPDSSVTETAVPLATEGVSGQPEAEQSCSPVPTAGAEATEIPEPAQEPAATADATVPGTSIPAATAQTRTAEPTLASANPFVIPAAEQSPVPTPSEAPKESAVPTATHKTSAVPTDSVDNTPPVTAAVHEKTPAPESPKPTEKPEVRLGVNLEACLAQNRDFVAWITIPGTKIDYPVVRSNNTEYYLHHMFSGKESQLGCLFSLKSSDYQAPSRNIAIYGHHLSQSDAMFSTRLWYKDPSYCASHSTIRLDSLYGSREYRVFAVVNMLVTDWDAATASFSGDTAFMRFVDRARQKALFETGVRVEADDHILTLITCDRGFGGVSGRLVVMAVQQ